MAPIVCAMGRNACNGPFVANPLHTVLWPTRSIHQTGGEQSDRSRGLRKA
jgi:hypothetical protein